MSPHAAPQDGFDPALPCRLCPRACGAVRGREPGFCGADASMRVALALLHPGEEPVLSGPQDPSGGIGGAGQGGGSGTIFFSGCALRCAYCQNHEISFGRDGTGLPDEALSEDGLAALMLELQCSGAHNINLVTPSHHTPQVRRALLLARANGLALPVVWNSSAYETVDALRSLEGLVDIYLPDLRYMDADAARRCSAAPDYPRVATHAILEMHHQVGRLEVDPATGLARRGLIIRLLALPGDLGRVDLALSWIADTLGTDTAVSLMGQYYPAHRAARLPGLDRGLEPERYAALLRSMEELGLWRGFTQQVGSSAAWTPEFPEK